MRGFQGAASGALQIRRPPKATFWSKPFDVFVEASKRLKDKEINGRNETGR